MPHYALYLEQEGEGCDYTIGCGRNLQHLRASTLEEAKVEAKEIVVGDADGYGGHFDESEVHRATLVSLVSDLPVEKWYAEHAAAQKQRKQTDAEAKEKAELARLLAKHGAP